MIRIRIVRKPAIPSLDGIQLSTFEVGGDTRSVR